MAAAEAAVEQAFRFDLKPGKEDYASCTGLYARDAAHEIQAINGKPWYLNDAQQRVLAWEGGSWVITAKEHLQGIATRSGFGGFHGASGAEPDTAAWDCYVCSSEAEEFTFEEGYNYPHHDLEHIGGVQSAEEAKAIFRAHPEADMFVYGPPGSGVYGEGIVWLKKAAAWENRRAERGQIAGFRTARFKSLRVGPSTQRLLAASKWQRLPSTTTSFKAVANSGVCRTEADFEAERHRCMASDCGGFAWRKPHFDQFGDEDNPPVCFFFRRSQAELRDALRPDNGFDLYLAPDEFVPETSFRPGRDPAPACHIRWEAGGPVHGFACQVRVAEPSPCTYYMACGFHCGYCGIQQHGGSKQQVLFSLWNCPKASGKVENRSVCAGITAQNFGGEGKGMGAYCITGTGASSDHQTACWQPGVTYTSVVRAFPVEGGSEFVCCLHKPCSGGWHELARHFRPEAPGDAMHGKLGGLYSFIEDFAANSVRRSGVWAAWVQDVPGGPWRAVDHVQGTTTAELDTPNKRVAPVPHGDGQGVEMVTGGDVLGACGVYAGSISPPSVPPELLEL